MHTRPAPRHGYIPKPSTSPGRTAATDVNDLKDTPWRSLIKALTYRILASGAMFLIFFILFRNYTNRTFSESVGDATIISVIDFVTKLAIYYAHERLWTNIKWGKYWQKHFLKRRAWRRHYRFLHQR
jgi:uncharacterized membrane protein